MGLTTNTLIGYQNSLSIRLISPNNGRGCQHVQALLDEFEEENISCSWELLVKDYFAALVLFNEKCSELELIDCVKDLLEQGERVIVMILKGARLPFHKVWELLGVGIDDVLQFQKKGLVGKMLIEKFKRWSIVEQYLSKELGKGILIGSSPIWLNTLRKIIEIACFSQMPLLILGESGTGKELVSRLIHELDFARLFQYCT